MKKNTLQKVFALILAGAMTMGALTACGSENPDDASAGQGGSGGATDATGSANAAEPADAAEPAGDGSDSGSVAGIDGWEPFAENVTLTIPVYDRGKEGVPTVTDNYWTKWIQENFGDKYNITVEFEPIPRNSVMTQYSLLAADQNLPTVLMEYDYDKPATWALDGYLAELDLDLFKQIAPTYYNRMVDLEQLIYVPLNGTNYFVLAERPYYNVSYTHVTWVRMDWLRQVGYDYVPTKDGEYMEAMRKIMEAGITEHPGIGKMTANGKGADQNHAYRAYPLNEEEWAMYGDYNIPSLGWYANKDLLRFENEKYNSGITDPEYYTIDEETEKAYFINGKRYEYSGYISASMDWLEAFYAENPDAELAVKPVDMEVDSETGKTPAYRTENPFGMMIGFSSQATEDEIKAAMMYMEWMLQEDVLFTLQWGIEGQNFNYDENGVPVSVPYDDQPLEYKQGFNNTKDYWCIAIEARSYGTIEETIAASSPQGLPVDFTQDILQTYYDKVEVAKNGYGIPNCMFGVAIESAAEYGTALQNLYVELRDKLVTCPADQFDALYEDYAKQYLDAGYQEIIDERLKVYQDGLTSHLGE